MAFTRHCGLTEEQAAKKIHARSNGDVTVGVDAFVSVWQRLPYYRSLSLIDRRLATHQVHH